MRIFFPLTLKVRLSQFNIHSLGEFGKLVWSTHRFWINHRLFVLFSYLVGYNNEIRGSWTISPSFLTFIILIVQWSHNSISSDRRIKFGMYPILEIWSIAQVARLSHSSYAIFDRDFRKLNGIPFIFKGHNIVLNSRVITLVAHVGTTLFWTHGHVWIKVRNVSSNRTPWLHFLSRQKWCFISLRLIHHDGIQLRVFCNSIRL